ncbi:hypothetical protein GCM10025795_04350 [Verticiella sediminum]
MSGRPDAAGSQPLLQALLAHYDELVRHVRRRFGGAGFARDVVHDTCLRLIEKPVAPARAPLALLRRMLHDAAVDHCRREDARRRWVEPMAELPEVATPPAAGPERIVAARRELDLLILAIDALPERCRTSFILHRIHGLPQAQIAQLLAITVKTVEKHVRTASRLCQARLDLQQGRSA